MKERGVILPVFSLPSKYGIGDFGNEAYEFVDILSKNNIDYWEILPINACNRLPYSPISYYALEEHYISLDKLFEHGLIQKPEKRKVESKVIYDEFKKKYCEEALKNFKPNEEYKEFIKSQEINEYAEYMCCKKNNKEYYLFVQYILYKQWMELKQYANSKNVKIIGDMPIYPAFDSAETKYYSQYFQMRDKKFMFEAGTPPDYFSSTGQKWGAPVYNVVNLKEDGYKYLVKRFKYHLKMFDKIRIDHFRGYDSFFKIPIGKLGTEGKYENGVGYDFFDELLKDKAIKVDNFVVEDLGDIREKTIKLREHYGFMGQKLLQSTIDLKNIRDEDVIENIMVLPGNHDCLTIKSWYETLSNEYKENLKIFLKRNNCSSENINLGVIQYCMKCKAKIAMVTVQDILELNDSARINIPGTNIDKNWSWKLIDFQEFTKKILNFR